MTSQLNVDTIVDKAGSGGSNVKMANTSTYVSDGGAVTQNTVQGLCKAWCSLDGTGTASFTGSFNMASITDHGTGTFTVTFTNAMANTNYSAQGTAGHAVGVTGDVVATFNSDSSIATNSCKFASHSGGTIRDVPFNFYNIHGDLA